MTTKAVQPSITCWVETYNHINVETQVLRKNLLLSKLYQMIVLRMCKELCRHRICRNNFTHIAVEGIIALIITLALLQNRRGQQLLFMEQVVVRLLVTS